MSTNNLENKLLNYYKISKQLLKEDRDKLLKLKLNELTIVESLVTSSVHLSKCPPSIRVFARSA